MFRITAILVTLALAVLLALYLTGPRVDADTTVSFDPTAIGPDPQAYIEAEEADVPGLRPDLAKEIVWAYPQSRAKTPLAIVYIHGFSASKGELRPMPDKVAAELGANLFYTRLAGHGRDGPAMAEATVNAWVNDYAEAIAIGRAIGEKVVVIATSTGASLATWAATDPELSRDVIGMVLISPNYGVQNAGAWLLTMPWGGQIAHLVAGREREFQPRSEAHGRYWTTRYPTSATLPMAALTELARAAPVETVATPGLFIFSDADKVVQPERTRAIAERWGAAHETMIVEGSDDPNNHVIAGDALSPSTTALVAGRISAWIGSLQPR
ncbi:alpha/beta fold hydrolase [Mesorhizobium sp. CAU 1732]|uniref:alpha/beta hydrolase n=1 Tax=Mesorhizobium sp. CAU 1732 TaxID=3140358 RepID=UPI0032617768